MDKMRKVLSIAVNNLRKWPSNPRIIILFILLIIFLVNYLKPIINFSNSTGYRVTPWVFPFFADSVFTQMIMMFGIVFLFCDAPFMDVTQPYSIIRSGRTRWGLGQVLYIMASTAIYFSFLAVVSCIIMSPNMFLSNEWGKVLGTLAQTNAGQVFNITLPINYEIQSIYTPVHAFFLSLILEWCAGTLLGLIIFIFNINFNRAIGAIVASVMVCLDMVIQNALPFYTYHFSILSLARLSILDTSGLSTRPTDIYAFSFFTVGIVLSGFIAVFSARKRSVKILPPV